MTAKGKRDSVAQREAPPILLVVGVVVLLLALGVGAFYTYNGGWKTTGQQDDDYKHNMLPIMSAKHGDMAPMEAENRFRRQQGQPMLELPKDKQQMAEKNRAKLGDLQKQLEAAQGKQSGP